MWGTCPMKCRSIMRLSCCAVALGGLLTSGCALQSDVFELGLDVKKIKELQDRLEQQLVESAEATETVRAMRVRMETVENKLREGVNPELEARISVGLKSLERERKQLAQERDAAKERLRESETFFVGRVQAVSAQQQGLSSRLIDIEGQVSALYDARSRDRAAEVARLESVEKRAIAAVQGLEWADAQLNNLDARLDLLENRDSNSTETTRMAQNLIERLDAQSEEIATLRQQVAQAKNSLEVATVAEQLNQLKATVERRMALVNAGAAADGDGDTVPASALGLLTGQLDELASELGSRVARVEALQSQMSSTSRSNLELAAQVAKHQRELDQLQATVSDGSGGAGSVLVENRLAELESNVDLRMDLLNDQLQSLAGREQLEGRLVAMQEELDDRLGRAEQRGVEVAALAEVADQLSFRIDEIDRDLGRLDAQGADPDDPLRTQLAGLARRLDQVTLELNERLDEVAQSAREDGPVDSVASGRLELVESALDERLARLENAQNLFAEGELRDQALADRLRAQELLVARLNEQSQTGGEDPSLSLLRDELRGLTHEMGQRMTVLEARAGVLNPTTGKPVTDNAMVVGLAGRVEQLEQEVEERLGRVEQVSGGSGVMSLLVDQVAQLEGRVDQGMSELEDKDQQLSERIEQVAMNPAAALLDRPDWSLALEQRVAKLAAEIRANADSDPNLSNRVAALERRLQAGLPSEAGVDEAAVSSLTTQMDLMEQSLLDRLTVLEQVGQDRRADLALKLAGLADRVNLSKVEVAGAVSELEGRLPVEQLTDLDDRLDLFSGAVEERLRRLEQSQSGQPSPADLDSRVAAIRRDTTSRIDKLEAQILALEDGRQQALRVQGKGTGSEADVTLLERQLDLMAGTVEDRLKGLERQYSSADPERVAELERQLQNAEREMASRLGQLEQRLESGDGSAAGAVSPDVINATVAARTAVLKREMEQRFTALEQQIGGASNSAAGGDSVAALEQRLAKLEQANDRPVRQLQAQVDALSKQVMAVASADSSAVQNDRLQQRVDEMGARLKALEKDQRQRSEQFQQQISGLSDAAPQVPTGQVQALQQRLADMSERMAKLEASSSNEIADLRKALSKVAQRSAAHVGAESVDTVELQSRLGSMNKRLETLDRVRERDTAELRSRFNALADVVSRLVPVAGG